MHLQPAALRKVYLSIDVLSLYKEQLRNFTDNDFFLVGIQNQDLGQTHLPFIEYLN